MQGWELALASSTVGLVDLTRNKSVVISAADGTGPPEAVAVVVLWLSSMLVMPSLMRLEMGEVVMNVDAEC